MWTLVPDTTGSQVLLSCMFKNCSTLDQSGIRRLWISSQCFGLCCPAHAIPWILGRPLLLRTIAKGGTLGLQQCTGTGEEWMALVKIHINLNPAVYLSDFSVVGDRYICLFNEHKMRRLIYRMNSEVHHSQIFPTRFLIFVLQYNVVH